MSKALLPSPKDQERIARKMWAKVEHDLEHGGDRARAAAMGIVRSVLLPAAPSKVTQQVLVASARDGGRLEAMGRAQARLAQDATDADYEVLAPLPRVQTDE